MTFLSSDASHCGMRVCHLHPHLYRWKDGLGCLVQVLDEVDTDLIVGVVLG